MYDRNGELVVWSVSDDDDDDDEWCDKYSSPAAYYHLLSRSISESHCR